MRNINQKIDVNDKTLYPGSRVIQDPFTTIAVMSMSMICTKF